MNTVKIEMDEEMLKNIARRLSPFLCFMEFLSDFSIFE